MIPLKNISDLSLSHFLECKRIQAIFIDEENLPIVHTEAMKRLNDGKATAWIVTSSRSLFYFTSYLSCGNSKEAQLVW